MTHTRPDVPVEPVRLAIAVDIVLFTIRQQQLELLLVQRGIEPFRDEWALPGGFVLEGEGLEDAAVRELQEETTVDGIFLEQLYTFGEPDRDPRFRVVSVVYYALASSAELSPSGGSDARAAAWFPVTKVPDLAFDHDTIVDYALRRLRAKLEYAPVAFQLLPRRFTLTELQQVYETVLDRALDKRNFRRKILSLGFLRRTDARRRAGRHRPAQLYELCPDTFATATSSGGVFRQG